uniref:Cytochrome c oxidase subunit 3 n=1 Tax=Asotana magnifica TaxID=2528170 RepID=A0A4P8DNA6_9CRUS|nr:cytochrome c oxidase subunit 3 [Asotana magnifica]
MLSLTHPYHLVNMSPWPLTSSMGALFLTSGLINWFYSSSMTLIILSLMSIILSMIQWWRDISRESTYQGLHTHKVQVNMKWGMILFITSEVLFFFSFFWSFFHSSLSPTLELGSSWPPSGISPMDPFSVPLLNTIILLSSGMTVTWSHHSILSSYHKQAMQSLLLTILLGIYFTILQYMEYLEASFSIADSIYGSSFFVATGFHGLHVIIGSSFLMVCLMRLKNGHYSKTHHFGFEAAAWYWHFVDVVWLFLYSTIYWWGS